MQTTARAERCSCSACQRVGVESVRCKSVSAKREGRVSTRVPKARHVSLCMACRCVIDKGDDLRWSARFGRWVHLVCPEVRRAETGEAS